MSEEVKEKVNKEIFKCPQCGANLSYDIASQSLACEFCGFQMALKKTSSNEEHDFENRDNSQDSRWDGTTKIANCKNCGAEIIVGSNDLSIVCPFCQTPMVTSDEEIKGMKPDRIIPFRVSDKDCIANYQKWLKKKLFAPSKIKKLLPKPSLYSTYIPSWTYDSEVSATYEGRLGKEYTETVGSGKNERTVTRVEYFKVSGTYDLTVDDVLVNAGKSITQSEIHSIEPFETNGAIVYDNKFIAGHGCEHYRLDVDEGWTEAKKIIDARLRSGILSKYDYDVVDYLKVYPTYANVKYKYVILPIWLCYFLFGKKKYRFIANGENGKISGNYPKSAIKIGILVFFILVIIGVLLYFYMTKK